MEVVHYAESENEQLINKIVAGNREAETQLVSKFYRPLLFILRQQTKDPHLAEDLCQDSFCVVLRKVRNGEIKNPDGLGAFVRSVGINLLIEFKRKATRQKTDTTEDFSHIESVKDDSTESQISKAKIIELLEQVLLELPTQRDRDILHMSFVEGAEKSIICDKLALSPEHYDKVLYRAKQRLRQLMAIKLSLKNSKFRLIDIVTISLALGVSYQMANLEVRETPLTHHLINDVLMKSQNLR